MRLGHVVLRTTRLEEMSAWYCEVLGAHVVEREGGVAFLTFDEEHHRIALVHAEQQAPGSPLAHVAFAVDTRAELDEVARRLRGNAIEPIRCVEHPESSSLYYRDPDDNEIELYCARGISAFVRAR